MVTESDLRELRDRVARLETVNRWQRRILSVGALGVIGVLCLGQAAGTETPQQIEAQCFVVKDKSGRITARLGPSADQKLTVLDIANSAGSGGIRLVAGSGGTGLFLSRDSFSITVGLADRLPPYMEFCGGDDTRLKMALDDDGTPSVDLRAKSRVHFRDTTAPGLSKEDSEKKKSEYLKSEAEALRFTLSLNSSGLPYMLLSDAAGNTRTAIGASSRKDPRSGTIIQPGAGSIAIYGEDQLTLWHMP